MHFSNLKAASILAFTASLASCAPTSSPVYPPTSISQNFLLVVNVTSADLSPSIKDFVVTSYHIGAGEDYAVLAANTDANSGRIFYVNGTATDVQYHTSDILSDEGTPLFPAGITINAPNSAGERTVSINAGVGEPGIGLTSFPDPISELRRYEGDGFYACNNELPYGPAVQLLYKEWDEVTPEGCVDISLLAQCSEGSGLEHPFGNNVNCYADVAAIDWSVYNSD